MKALTVGGATIDTIAIIESDHIERMTMLNADASFLLMQEGAKTEAGEISTHCGGGAVNAAVGMSRLGFDVSALLKLGRDQRAETVLARLMEEGISTRWVSRDGGAPTGASVLVSSHDRNAAVFTFRGANTLLSMADLKDEAFGVDLVYVSTLSNQSASCFPKIVEKAKEAGATVAVNPGPRQLASRAQDFEATLGAVDILTLNRSEAEVMLPSLVPHVGEGGLELSGDDLPKLAAQGLSGGSFHMSLRRFISAVRSLGPRLVLITNGTEGAYLGIEGKILFVPTLPTAVAGTAGAGDAFASTFASQFVAYGDVERALKAATLNASSVVAYVDTQSGLLSAEAIDNAILEEVYGKDLTLNVPLRLGTGFMLVSKERLLGSNPRTFGHTGVGGSLGMADLDARVSWSYTMNRPLMRSSEDRARRISKALYATL